MTTRVLEPEVMDTPEEAREYDAMDHAAVNRAFVEDLLAAGPVAGDVLDLGTGTAQIPIELCRQCHSCRVLAADLSIHMLDLARYNIEVASLIERIELRHVDAKSLPYPDGTFQLVMSNSIVHHIPDPAVMIGEAVRVTAKGGRLFFRDLARPDEEEQVGRLVEIYARGESDRARQLFEQSLRAALTVEEMRGVVEPLGFDPQTVQMTSDRHWTWAASM